MLYLKFLQWWLWRILYTWTWPPGRIASFWFSFWNLSSSFTPEMEEASSSRMFYQTTPSRIQEEDNFRGFIWLRIRSIWGSCEQIMNLRFRTNSGNCLPVEQLLTSQKGFSWSFAQQTCVDLDLLQATLTLPYLIPGSSKSSLLEVWNPGPYYPSFQFRSSNLSLSFWSDVRHSVNKKHSNHWIV
jgi:hypothetical protein